MEGNKEYRADDDEKQESKSDQEVVQSNKKSQICSEDNKPQDEADELNCGICNKPFSVEYEAFFLFCEHFYHKVCLAKYCNYFVSKKQFPIKCPNSECLQPIKYDDIKQILKYADFKNYVKLTLLNAGDLNCELCNKQMKNFDAIFLTCKHIFHVICLNKYRSKGQSPIKCPNSECSMTLQLDQTEQQKQGCEICYEPMTINNHYLLICEHIFHKVCLAKYCNYFVRKIQFPIKCPNSQCLQHIKYDDIKQILEYADFKNYVKLTLLKSGDLNCELCNKQMKNFDAIFLTCKHIFHVICLFKYRSKGQSPIKCPNSECSMTLQLDQTEQQKYKYFNYPKISLQSIYDQDCEICYEPMTSNNCYLLICKHIYHKVCLSKHCNTLINEKQFPINCPHFKCLIPLQQNEIKKILSEVDFEKYEKFTLQNYIDSNADEFSWCPTPNCQYAFVIDSNQTYLKCPSCEKSYCLTCKCDFHEGQTCKEYQISNQHTEQDGHFEKYVKSLKFKQCLNCKMWVEKTIGCDHMTCRCKYQFCYKCGGPYLKCSCNPGFINPFQTQLINVPNQMINPNYSMNNQMQQQPSYLPNNQRLTNQNRLQIFEHQNLNKENYQSNLFQQQMIQTQPINEPNQMFNSPYSINNTIQQQHSYLPNNQRLTNQNRLQMFEQQNLNRENYQSNLFQQQMIQTQPINEPNQMFNSPYSINNTIQQQHSYLPNNQRQTNQNGLQSLQHQNVQKNQKQANLF